MNMHYDRSQGKVPRRQALIAGLLVMALAGPSLAQSRPIAKVWKDPSCGCCKDWVSHLQGAGFDVQVLDTGNTAARTRLRSEEHTSELQSRLHLVCRLLLEKKKVTSTS